MMMTLLMYSPLILAWVFLFFSAIIIIDDFIKNTRKANSQKSEAMTRVEQLEQRGMQQGIRKEKYEIAKKMLIRKEFNLKTIAGITNLTIKQLKAIK